MYCVYYYWLMKIELARVPDHPDTYTVIIILQTLLESVAFPYQESKVSQAKGKPTVITKAGLLTCAKASRYKYLSPPKKKDIWHFVGNASLALWMWSCYTLDSILSCCQESVTRLTKLSSFCEGPSQVTTRLSYSENKNSANFIFKMKSFGTYDQAWPFSGVQEQIRASYIKTAPQTEIVIMVAWNKLAMH